MKLRTLVRILLIAASVPLGLFLWGHFFSAPPESAFRAVALNDMVFVPGGRHFGVELDPFYIDRCEVTEADWAAFVRATGAGQPLREKGERRAPDYPIRHVSLEDAQRYAAWCGKRIPNNREWDRASRGPGDSRFPWGAGYLPLANTAEAWENRGFRNLGVVRVGIFAMGRSAVGAQDMVGNVREWTVSPFEEALRDERARRFALASGDERGEELLVLKSRLDLRRESWTWPVPRTVIESPAELQPDPRLAREARLDLIELLPVLTAFEEVDFRRSTGTELRDDQFVIDWMASERVVLGDIVDDVLAFESPDPRRLPVIGAVDLEILEEAGAEVDPQQFLLQEPRTVLTRSELLDLLPESSRADAPSLELDEDLEFLPVLDMSSSRRLDALKFEVERGLEEVEAWREEFAEFLRLQRAAFAGERHVIVRGGSFRTRIKGGAVVLEDIENAGNAAWDLGFRCVVSLEEVERQTRFERLIRDLGWRDPWNTWFRVREAEQALVDAGPPALPYLRRARSGATQDSLRSRLDAIIAEIESRE